MKPVPPKRAAFKLILQRILLILLAVGLTLGAADVFLRFADSNILFYRAHERFAMRHPEWNELIIYRKNRRFAGETHGDLAAILDNASLREPRHLVFETDAHGYRNIDEAAEAESLDAIVLGDSFAIGNGTDQDATWVTLLNRRHGINTYSLAQVGNPYHHLLLLMLEMDRLPLRAGGSVILAICSGNDLWGPYRRVEHIKHLKRTSFSDRCRVGFHSFKSRSPVLALLGGRVRSGEAGSSGEVSVIDTPAGKVCFLNEYTQASIMSESEVCSHPHYAMMVDAMLAINRICAQKQWELIVVYMPAKGEVYRWMLNGEEPMGITQARSGFSSALEYTCAKMGVDYVDLSEKMIAEGQTLWRESRELLWWRDDTHMNPAGHALCANVVAAAIAQQDN